jgi:uncharacterized protein (TIGR00297 family)
VQVAANGGPAALAACWYAVNPDPALAAAYLASLTAAAADTWATEVGTAFGTRCVRISNLASVAPGVSGAVTLPGLAAALVGSAFLAAFSPPLGLTHATGGILLVGFGACLADSLLGDLVQGRFVDPAGVENEQGVGTRVRGVRWLNNDGVNLVCTTAAAVCGYFLV